MIKPRIDQPRDKLRVGKLPAIGIEPCHKPGLLGIRNQLKQVVPQGGFTAGKDDMGYTQAPDFIQNGLPALSGQFGVGADSGVVAMGTVVVTAVGERQVHAIRRT